MNIDDKIYVAGHRGLVGSAILRELKHKGFKNILTRTHKELDLINQDDVKNFFKEHKPDFVILAAAKVGGIFANNTFPAEFIYQNLMVEANVIHNSYLHNVKRLLFLGSTCIYPR
jgi:GDP-L-fucose synthase